jgi:hypothetical protein
MNYKKISFLTCLILSFFCSSLKAEDETITFTPPKGWSLAEKTQLPPRVKVLVVGPKISAFPPSINLAIEPYKGTMKEYLKIVKDIALSKNGKWKDLGDFKTEAGNANLSQLDTKNQWGELRMMHVMLLKDGMMYIVTVTALKNEFPTYYKQFFDAFRSLKFESGKEGT